MAPVVLAQQVTKWYGPRRAVTDVSFAIEQGEIVGLLGPNGSGKSTIFRMLTGYLVPTSGSIEVAGHDVVGDSRAVRDLVRSLAGRHTVLLASHILPEIEKVASRVMILLDGALLTADALKESTAGPVLRLSADGSEQVIRGVVTAIAGVRGLSVDPDGGATPRRYLIQAERRPALAVDILAALVGAGIAVSELTERPADLERVFLE